MRSLIRCIACPLLFSLILCSATWAQNPPSKKGGETPLLDTELGKQTFETLKIEHLRVQNAAIKFKGKNKAIEAQLLSILEDMAMHACAILKDGNWDFYSVHSASDTCRKQLTSLSASSPDNKIVRCIQRGKHSSDCVKLFSEQQTISIDYYKPDPSVRLNQEHLDGTFSTPYASQHWKAMQEIRMKMLHTQDEEEKASLRNELLQHQLRSLSTSCSRQPLIFYEPLSELGVRKESFQGQQDPEAERIRELIEDYRERLENEQKKLKESVTSLEPPQALGIPASKSSEKQGQQKTEAGEELVRVRVLSEACMQAITGVLEFLPLSKAAICKRDGLFHPTCEQAKRNSSVIPSAGNEKDTEQRRNKDSSDQISTF